MYVHEISGRLYTKRDQPEGQMSSGVPTSPNITSMTRIAFYIWQHLSIQNTFVKFNPIYDTGH